MQTSMWSLALIQGMDSISYMVMAPSLIFYVLQCGGTTVQYGWIISVFSFASFCTKPFMGYWIDAGGNKYRVPYIISTGIAAFGAFLYFLASAFKDSPGIAIALIFAGRVLGGIGAANQALGFAYIASVVPSDEQTKTNTLLSMVRILGMASGPAFNLFLSKANGLISFLPNHPITLDNLNSVGLFLLASNLLAIVAIYFLLEEPPEKPLVMKKLNQSEDVAAARWKAIKSCFSLDIMLPMLALFVVNSSFQLIETAFPPAASDALGWGPVQTSGVLGSASVLLFFCMMAVFYLSSKKVDDLILIAVGNSFWCVGGFMLYMLWARGVSIWHFIVPIVVCVCGFPFIAPANRSIFTKAVDSKPELESMQGFMQSILSMAASIAGFVTPGFVASYVLREPQEVAASPNQRELGPLALYVPLFPIFIMVGLFVMYKNEHKAVTATTEETITGETTSLLERGGVFNRRHSEAAAIQSLSATTEMNRRHSAAIMGICMGETLDEKQRRSSIIAELQEYMIDEEDD